MEYTITALQQTLPIREIVTVHYFEYAKNFLFEGEAHDFWEFLYVDKGEVEVMAGREGYRLRQGQMIFHPPNEFHNVWANGKTAPNLIVVSFLCEEPGMEFFRKNHILQIGNREKDLLAGIVREAEAAFSSPLGDPALKKLERAKDPPFGCEQMIRLHLEQLLIGLVRAQDIHPGKTKDPLSSAARERFESELVRRIQLYMQEHISEQLSFEDIREYSMQSSTNLKVIFKEATGMGVMEAFQQMKIEEAKRLIREGNNNFTQISEILGFSSIHYFSRSFKNRTGMTLSQYATSVKIKI